jgi:hypothetical protein
MTGAQIRKGGRRLGTASGSLLLLENHLQLTFQYRTVVKLMSRQQNYRTLPQF